MVLTKSSRRPASSCCGSNEMDGRGQLLVGFTAGAGVAAALYYLHQRKSATTSTATLSQKKRRQASAQSRRRHRCRTLLDDTPKTVEALAAMGRASR